jgi:RNA polymerase sigma factor (sigma-70 family)
MATSQLSRVIQTLRTATLQDGAGLSDGQLLDHFIERRDEAAFAALVRRHGPVVWGVCHRVLGRHHDAEDAFQATFLVLARKAASVRPREMVANWLFGVAHRTALNAKATAEKRRAREKQVMTMPEPESAQQDSWHNLVPLIDQELAALPDKYRVAIVLCDLEGKTGKEAACQLKIPEGTLSSRLRTARVMLAKRLARHGLVLSGGALAMALSQNAASAFAPAAVVSNTIKAAPLFAAGQAAATSFVPAKVAALSERVMNGMFVAKLKIWAGFLLVAGLLVGTAILLASGASGQDFAGVPMHAEKNQAPLPAQALRLTLEAPDGPVVLDRALSGRIPIRLSAENLSDQRIIVCQPVDGSLIVKRDPQYIFRLVDEKGREVPRTTQDDCPSKNALHTRDFLTLQPKKKTDLLKTAGIFGELTTYLFPDLKPGEYKLTVTYVMAGDGNIHGVPAGLIHPKVQTLLQEAHRCEVTSDAVKVRIIPAPSTEELLKVLKGKGEKVVSPADALLVMGYRRDQRGYAPTLAALADKDWQVRWAAAFTLRDYAAAYSVGQLKDKHIIPPELLESLNNATKDPDGRVREIAAISLKFAREYRDFVKAKK